MDIKRTLMVASFAFLCAVSSAQNGVSFGFGILAGTIISDFTGSTDASGNGFFDGIFAYYTTLRLGSHTDVNYSQQGVAEVVNQPISGNRVDRFMDCTAHMSMFRVAIR